MQTCIKIADKVDYTASGSDVAVYRKSSTLISTSRMYIKCHLNEKRHRNSYLRPRPALTCWLGVDSAAMRRSVMGLMRASPGSRWRASEPTSSTTLCRTAS